MSTDQSRDERWFAEIFDSHADAVHRYARRRLHGASDSNADADDVTAEVFAITWRRRHDVHEPVLAWLYGVARRVVASHQRTVLPLLAVDRVDDDTSEGGGSRENAGEMAGEYVVDTAAIVTDDLVLREAWRTLSARDREVLLLAAWEGLGEAQIASVLDISVGAASAALSRARRRLRQAIAAYDEPDTGS